MYTISNEARPPTAIPLKHLITKLKVIPRLVFVRVTDLTLPTVGALLAQSLKPPGRASLTGNTHRWQKSAPISGS